MSDVFSYLAGNTIDYHASEIGKCTAKGGEPERISKSLQFIVDAKNVLAERSEMAYKDALTGLGNRGFFDETLEKRTSLARRTEEDISLVFFDIDNFKLFNDNYGHDAGDYVLSSLGKIVNKNVRDSDIACRYGGEEVAVILPNTDKKGGYIAAEKIRSAVEGAEWNYEGKDLGKVTVSLGVSGYNYNDVGSFVKEADVAMYSAKADGRNRTVVSED